MYTHNSREREEREEREVEELLPSDVFPLTHSTTPATINNS